MSKNTPRDQIIEGAKALQDIMTEGLSPIADEMIRQAMSQWRAKKPALTGDIAWPGEQAYLANVREALTVIATDAIDAARKEVPKAKNVQLSDIQFASQTVLFDKLPKSQRDFISKQSDLLVGTQLQDLEKNLKFQYMDSFDTSQDENVIEDDLRNVCADYIDGQAIKAGANLVSAKTVNESRSAFFMDSDTLDNIDAFQFLNGDPVTPICQDLDGTIFAKDDPNMFRYTPPLHWNCKSYIVPILAGNLGDALDEADQDSIEPLKPSTQKLEDMIQFCECGCCS